MDRGDIAPEEKIYYYVNKTRLNNNEIKDLLYQLTMLNWDKIEQNYGRNISQRIIQKVIKMDIEDIESISNIILLYNNPYGIYTLEFVELITKIYSKDKIRFIKGLNLVKEEAINIVYVFRLRKIFIDDVELERDIEEIQNSQRLSYEEK